MTLSEQLAEITVIDNGVSTICPQHREEKGATEGRLGRQRRMGEMWVQGEKKQAGDSGEKREGVK